MSEKLPRRLGNKKNLLPNIHETSSRQARPSMKNGTKQHKMRRIRAENLNFQDGGCQSRRTILSEAENFW